MADPKAPEMPEGWSSIGGDDSAPLSFVCKRNWFVISLQRISELLSAHGLHIVSESDKQVLEDVRSECKRRNMTNFERSESFRRIQKLVTP